MFIISIEHFSFAVLAAVPPSLCLFHLQIPISGTAPLWLLRAVPRQGTGWSTVSLCILKVARARPLDPKEF